MRSRYLLVPALVVSGIASLGCSETDLPGDRAAAPTAISQQANLAKLRSSPYYHTSASSRPTGASDGQQYSVRRNSGPSSGQVPVVRVNFLNSTGP
jgi:hypothetical protein